MNNIEVGEYVKVKEWNVIGRILKVTGRKVYIDSLGFGLSFEQIQKHSKNIIDLIEVGDIVETYDVLNNDIIYIWSDEMLKALKEDIENGIGIKSVVTREQFKSMQYKLETEDK